MSNQSLSQNPSEHLYRNSAKKRMLKEACQPLLVAGMHRSGTSLTASMLQAAGVDIGKHLIGPGNGNRMGHFEDVEVCSLHCDILEAQGIHKDGWAVPRQVDVAPRFKDRARRLYQLKERCQQKKALTCNKPSVWGWKDPRTALFLNFWYRQIPDAKFVFVYRKPWEVVQSLTERGDIAIAQNPQLAITAWLVYNSAIFSFYQQNAARCFLFSVDSFRDSEKFVLTRLCKKLHLSLHLSCPAVYQPSQLHSLTRHFSIQTAQQALQDHLPCALTLYRALEAAADLPSYCQPSELATQPSNRTRA
ncbi:MAG: sulfotransferase [Cyanobacteria bacterium J06560_6]